METMNELAAWVTGLDPTLVFVTAWGVPYLMGVIIWSIKRREMLDEPEVLLVAAWPLWLPVFAVAWPVWMLWRLGRWVFKRKRRCGACGKPWLGTDYSQIGYYESECSRCGHKTFEGMARESAEDRVRQGLSPTRPPGTAPRVSFDGRVTWQAQESPAPAAPEPARADDWGPEGPQRAYKCPCGCVHFYPSHCWKSCDNAKSWHDDRPMDDCPSLFVWEKDFDATERIPDAAALSIWRTRPTTNPVSKSGGLVDDPKPAPYGSQPDPAQAPVTQGQLAEGIAAQDAERRKLEERVKALEAKAKPPVFFGGFGTGGGMHPSAFGLLYLEQQRRQMQLDQLRGLRPKPPDDEPPAAAVVR